MAPLLAEGFRFTWPWLADLLIIGALYATLAVGLNLVTGYAGMFSLGHHGFYAVGAYAAGFVVTEWSAVDPGSASGLLCFAVSGAAAVLASAAAGLLVGLPCLRLRGDYLAIATLAFGEIVRIVIENTPRLEGSLGLFVPRVLLDPTGQMGEFRALFLAIGVALLVGTALLVRNLIRSAHGRSIVSLREDEIASELLGVHTTAYKVRAFVLGAALAGLCGWFYAHYNGSIGPRDFDMMVGIKILLIVVLGGLGSLSGSFVAAFLLIGIERLLQTGMLGETLKEWVQVEYALVLILLMLLRPDGILGKRELSDLFRSRGSRTLPTPIRRAP